MTASGADGDVKLDRSALRRPQLAAIECRQLIETGMPIADIARASSSERQLPARDVSKGLVFPCLHRGLPRSLIFRYFLSRGVKEAKNFSPAAIQSGVSGTFTETNATA